ncbi:MAG: fumarylacetoacetate hydrolase family protein [Bryobacteraceae bacterium]|jgi:2-dehydro-3-deoxy-D-arabinonate dehydratase
MRLGQLKWNNTVTAAIFENDQARPIPEYNLYDLIVRSEKEHVELASLAGRLAAPHLQAAPPVIPLSPREVWACDRNYEGSSYIDGYRVGVDRIDRPEIFFKGTARVCVGPGQAIGIRSDSRFTAPEPELALVLGGKGRVIGYTIGNDVSAWDIERDNPLYLTQSKTFTGCCALGPQMVTVDEIPDPYNLRMSCKVERAGRVLFAGEASTASMQRKFDTLVEFLLRGNPVPAGSVLLTGTGIIVPREAALAAGDVVTIRVPGIGVLSNTAAMV